MSTPRSATDRLALPVDALLPAICAAVAEHPIVLIEAEPGAGKTTRVPAALDEAFGKRSAQLWVLEPRRLAARLAATRVAQERGETVGGSVGYAVRFEDRRTAETRIVYATEGVLVRRLAQSPTLPGIDIVILDEFHERHLQTDLALALLRQAQLARPSLRLVLMSATLGAERLAESLPGAVVLRAPGRVFPVDVEYLPEGAPDRHLDQDVASAVRRLIAPTSSSTGDVLVFLPGAAEIRRAQTALAAEANRVEVVVLHGDLSPAEQDRAVRPGPRQKVILSTNVAESSVTIEGVTAVVDSGLHRLASHSPISGLPTLRVARIARSSAIQRAGRAGRTGPGRCVRLYTQHDFTSRPADSVPEIERAELSELVLLALAIDPGGPESLRWVTPPPRAALEVAGRLLADLGATDDKGALTPIGRELLALPLHPRLGRLILAGRQRKVEPLATLAASMLSEGAARSNGDQPTDLVDEVVLLIQAGDLERRFPAVARSWQRLGGRRASRPPTVEEEAALRAALLTAFADRVGRVDRQKGAREVQLAGGQRLQIARPPIGFDHAEGEWLVALDAEERRDGTQQRLRLQSYATIPLGALLDQPKCEMDSRTEWIDEGQRIAVVDEVRYGALLLDHERRLFAAGTAPPEATQALGLALTERRNLTVFAELVPPDELTRLQQRIAVAGQTAPGLVATLGAFEVAALLLEFAPGVSSVREVKQLDLLARWLDRLSSDERRRFEVLAPERLRLHAGRTAQIEYPVGAEPFVASRLQDFFGQASVPLVGGQPLTVHLLAPNGRPVQVTRDLPSFWKNQYPELRNALSRRYPRHAWPDDPLAAEPSLPTPRRR